MAGEKTFVLFASGVFQRDDLVVISRFREATNPSVLLPITTCAKSMFSKRDALAWVSLSTFQRQQ